jgi:signal transduction histidine kinase
MAEVGGDGGHVFVGQAGEMTDQPTTNLRDERRFDRGSWIALAYAVVIFVCSAAEIAFSLSLPHDGWVITSAGAATGIQLEFNWLGRPSKVRQNDLLLAIDGKSVTQIHSEALAFSGMQPRTWPDGHILQYTVRRGGEELTVDVPVHYYSLLDYQLITLRWDSASHLAQVISSLLFFALGILVFFRRPREPAAHALLFIGTGFFFQWLYIPDSVIHIFDPFASVFFQVFNSWTNAIVPSLAYIILAFPTPRWPLTRFPHLTLALLYLPYSLAAILCYLLLPHDPVALEQALFYVGVSPLIWILLTLPMLIHSIFSKRGPVERAQTKWLAFGMGSFICIGITSWLVGVPLGSTLGWLMLPICVAIAILRYRLFDIDLIINRALVYGTLTVLVISMYVFVVGYLGTLFTAKNNLMISLLATGLVAVLFQPLRDRLQLAVNRLMYGRRDEPVAVLSQLGARLEETIIPDQILPGIVRTVTQALKLPYAAIALKVAGDYEIQAESGYAAGPREVFPLIYQGQTIGQFLVSRRAPHEDFSPADRLLLVNIARQAGAVAHAVQLNAALQQSRQQLVTAREEERRRLRRDLHDGLGPQLASQVLTIDAIGKLLEHNPEKAKELLQHLKTQLQDAIQDIRRLVYNLRPPALDELGLVAALQEGARQDAQDLSLVEITTEPEPFPVLPAAIEVAVYRIVQEAMTNVLRHARARRCNICMTVRDDHVNLTITDDGGGYPENVHFGIGLNSMRERAEELGGMIQFGNQSQGGARVQVWLPLPGDV